MFCLTHIIALFILLNLFIIVVDWDLSCCLLCAQQSDRTVTGKAWATQRSSKTINPQWPSDPKSLQTAEFWRFLIIWRWGSLNGWCGRHECICNPDFFFHVFQSYLFLLCWVGLLIYTFPSKNIWIFQKNRISSAENDLQVPKHQKLLCFPSVCEGRTGNGHWGECRDWHINVLELEAVWLALNHFAGQVGGQHVLIRSENTSILPGNRPVIEGPASNGRLEDGFNHRLEFGFVSGGQKWTC